MTKATTCFTRKWSPYVYSFANRTLDARSVIPIFSQRRNDQLRQFFNFADIVFAVLLQQIPGINQDNENVIVVCTQIIIRFPVSSSHAHKFIRFFFRATVERHDKCIVDPVSRNALPGLHIFAIDRKYKKDAFYAYKAWLNPEPMVHLCGKRYIDRVEEVTKVTVYSNAPEVELFANGVSLGKKQSSDHFFYFDVPNHGETKLEAVAGELRDESFIRKVDQMNPDYILREQGAVLNWFDITEIEGRFSLNSKIGEVTKTLRGKLWFAGLFLTLARKMSQNKPQSADKKKKKKQKNPEMNSGVMNMIGGFSVLRFTGMLGMRNVTFTKEELLKMNRQLNKIKIPKE